MTCHAGDLVASIVQVTWQGVNFLTSKGHKRTLFSYLILYYFKINKLEMKFKTHLVLLNETNQVTDKNINPNPEMLVKYANDKKWICLENAGKI